MTLEPVCSRLEGCRQVLMECVQRVLSLNIVAVKYRWTLPDAEELGETRPLCTRTRTLAARIPKSSGGCLQERGGAVRPRLVRPGERPHPVQVRPAHAAEPEPLRSGAQPSVGSDAIFRTDVPKRDFS